MKWLLFFIALLAPAMASAIAGALDSRNGDVAPAVAMIGGGMGGIWCGVMLGSRLGSNISAKIILGVIFAGVMTTACIGMSFFGCMARGL